MFRSQVLRQAIRATARVPGATASARVIPTISQRSLHNTRPLSDKLDEEHEQLKEGSFARTDPNVEVEHIEEELPSSTPVQGRGGLHFKRTLAAFSLEGRVGVVTGGARGLGLVMSQALVISGADVAIVDMNSMYYRF